MSGKKEELVQATDPSSSKFKYETKLVNLRRYVIFCNFPWAHHTIWVQLKTWIVWLCNNGWFPAILNWVFKLLKFYAQHNFPTNIHACLFKSYLDYQSLDKVWIMFLMIKNLKNPWRRGLRLMSSLFRIEKFVSFRHFNCDFKLPFSANIGAKPTQELLYSILYSQAKRSFR